MMDINYLYAPIHLAAKFGNLEMMKFLLANGADARKTTSLASDANSIKNTASTLVLAMMNGHDEVVELLLKRHLVRIRGGTWERLYGVAKLGHVNIVFAILQYLAKTNSYYEADDSLLYRMLITASKNNHFVETFEMMKIRYAEFVLNLPKIILDILSKDQNNIMKHIENNADLNIAYQKIDTTPLASACACHNIEIVKLLLEHGASVADVTGWPDRGCVEEPTKMAGF
jgi:ankyrin repeat protein